MSDSDPNTPALNANGTLKDASEIDWVHSPSAEDPPMLSKPEKRKRTDSMDSTHLQVAGDKHKPQPRREGKRMKRVSERGKAAADELNTQQRHFFSRNFVGKFITSLVSNFKSN
jgi:hypothetical protein